MRPFTFVMRPPANPLVRLLLGLVGVALLGFFTLFGLLVAGLMLGVFALRRLYLSLNGKRPARPSPVDPRVIEGEFSVVEKPRIPR